MFNFYVFKEQVKFIHQEPIYLFSKFQMPHFL